MSEQPRTTRRWHRPMLARDTAERHRVSTPLELLFDLCFVVAVSAAGVQLHHSLGEGDAGHGIVLYLVVFFSIWWGWVNFTWFASAFDTNDVPYRIATFVQILGALVVAAGVPAAWHDDMTTMVVGYLLMRLSTVGQWLRVARQDPLYRSPALRSAVGITVVQVGWVLRLAVPEPWFVPSFLTLLVAELVVPVWAERTIATTWPWHARHISERYGLFTLIVLGESVLAASNALQAALGSGQSLGELVSVGVAGLVIVFGMWWLYFDQPGHVRLAQFRQGYTWGYGHYMIFGSAAAVGVGLELVIDDATHAGHLGAAATAFTLTVPIALYLLSVWLLHIGPRNAHRTVALGYPVAAVLVIAMSFTPLPALLTALVLASLVAATAATSHGHLLPD